MAIVITQTCDACDRSRVLSNLKNHDDGGWRILNHKIVCAQCISDLFDNPKGVNND